MKRMIVARGGKRGKTAGRGGKGQSARAGNKRRPEWRDIIKRLPKLRGRGVNQQKPITDENVVVNLDVIEAIYIANEAVTPKTLIEKGTISTISGRIPAVKILGQGEITKAIKVSGCAISDSARAKVTKAGGTVDVPIKVVIDKRVVRKVVEEKPAPKAKPVKSAKPAEKKPEVKKTDKAPAKKEVKK